MANPYYLCAYGHVIRVSDRFPDDDKGRDDAANNTFGVRKVGSFPSGVTMIKVTGKGWAYRTAKEKQGLQLALAREHFKKTGNIAGGYTEEQLKPSEPKRGARPQLPGGNGWKPAS